MKKNYDSFKTKRISMWKFVFTLMAGLLSCQNISAQLTIPANNAYTTTSNRPLGAFYGHDRTLSVYTAAEMGITSGSMITAVRYFVQTAPIPATLPVFIYMKNTTGSSFTSGIYNTGIIGATIVHSSILEGSSVTAGRWITLPLTTPFEYTGNNLQIMVCTDIDDDPGQGTNDKTFRWSSTTSAQTQTWQSNIAATFPSNGTVTNSKPNIQILYNTPGAIGTLSWDYNALTLLENRTHTIAVNRSGGSTGAVSVNYATSNGTAIAGTDYTPTAGTLTWADGDMAPKTFTVTTLADFILDDAETINITLANPAGTTIVGGNEMVLTITDVLPPMSGTYTVGTGGNYASLSNAGGIFQAINNRVDGVSGPLTIDIISDLTGETGNNGLNEITGGHSVLIQPYGGARTVTGSVSNSVLNLGLIRFEGTDNVTINGSLTGATPASCQIGGDASLRQLTFVNNTSGTSAAILFQSQADGANNNTVKNINTVGYSPANGYGIMFRVFPSSISIPSTAHNENNRVENCAPKKTSIGIYSTGVSPSNQNNNLIITHNDITGTGTDRVSRSAIYIFNEANPQVTFNKVFVNNITGSSNSETVGLAIGAGQAYANSVSSGGISGAMVANNWITGVISTVDLGGSTAGIAISGTASGSPNIVQNNMISNVSGLSQYTYNVAGIWVVGAVASVTKLYNNTINLYGDRGSVSNQSPSYGIALSGLDPSLEMRNNIVSTTQIATGGGFVKTYAFGTLSTTFNNLVSNNNVFYSGGVQDGGFRSGALINNSGTSYATLADWTAATSKDASSIEVLPVFTAPNDLHLVAGSNPTIGIGTPIPSVTTDFDCQPRNAINPTPGADETNFSAFTISASAGTNGTISPSGTTAVVNNANQTYTITADCGYNIADVLVDGVSQGVITTYTFPNVAANHTISATFSGQLPTITVGGPTAICTGGSVILTSSSATGNTWNTGETTQSISAQTSANYWVTVNNGNCNSPQSNPVTVTITPPPTAPTITVSGSTSFCEGGSTTLTSSAATGNVWSTGATTQSIAVTTSGTYTVSNNSGVCLSAPSAGKTITVNPRPATPTITASGSTTFCNGGNVVLTSSSATGNTWSNGATTQSITVISSNTYTVTVSGGGCTSLPSEPVTTTVVLVPTRPTVTVTGTQTFCEGGSVVLTSSAATGNLWSNGETTQAITVTTSGIYTVTASVGGCTSTPSIAKTITVTPAPATPTISAGGPTTFCTGGSVVLTSSSATGNLWSNGATTQSITVSTSGIYTVTVINGSCTSAASEVTTITVNSLPTIPTITAGGVTTFCQGGSVVLTSSSATGNLWSNGATTQSITVSAAGTYTVTVNNGSCASGTSLGTSVTVNPLPATPTITASGATTFCSGGSVVLTSSSATGNVWSNGATTQSITVATSGTYSVTVNGTCTSAPSAGTTVTVNPLPATPTIAASGATNFCSGGSVVLTSSSATGNVWSNGATTQSITVATSGTYSVTVNGTCTSAPSAGTTVTVNPLPATPTIAASGATTFCSGGSVVLTSSSATGNVWSNGATTQSITVATSGTYSVTVNGTCTSAPSAGTTVTVNPLSATPTITASGATTFCSGGSVVLTSSSATGNVWSNGATTQSITVATSGTYSVTVNGTCTSAPSAGTTVTVNSLPATPTIAASGATTFCSGESVVLTSSSATGNVWSNGATTQSITVGTSGTYSVTVSGTCTSAPSAGTMVTVNALPNAGVTQSGGIVTATESGATYQWFTCANIEIGNESGQTFTPTMAGDYYVVISNGNCTVTSACISVSELDTRDFADNRFTIYPNPVSDILNIEYSGSLTKVEVFNIVGQKVISRNVDSTSTQIDMSNLPAGTFFVKVASGKIFQTFKVIKN